MLYWVGLLIVIALLWRLLSKLKIIISALVVWVIILIGGYLYWSRNPHASQFVIDQTQRTVITALQSSLKLETAEMNMTKSLEGKQQLNQFFAWYQWTNVIQEFLFGDTIQILAEWTIKAWFDLKKIGTWSVLVHPDLTVTLILPAPEIINSKATAKVLNRDRWALTRGNIQLESAVREQAEKAFIQEALSGGILESAQKNAIIELEKLLKGTVSIKEITFAK